MTIARRTAVSIVSSLLRNHDNLDSLVANEKTQLSEKDKRLLQAISFGVCRKWFELIFIISRLVKRPLHKKNQFLQAVLLCGIFELIWHRTPSYAIVSEYVDIASDTKKPWAKSFVNAVLRTFLREKEVLYESMEEIEAVWNHPKWFIDDIKEAWPRKWQKILKANNTHPPMTLRVNLSKISRQKYLSLLSRENIEAKYGTPNSSIMLKTPVEVRYLPGWDLGYCSIQDSSSQWISLACNPKRGERILDACAAPGGKSCHLLEIAPIHLTSVDINSDRLLKLRQNANRLSLKPTIVAADATKPDTWWDKKSFDKILIDAPCSATGVIRRHPDIRLLKRSKVDELIVRQTLLILHLWPLLKAGGQIIYSTCSLLQKENDQRIVDIMQHLPATIKNLDLIPGEKTKYGRLILPSRENDGFYCASLIKSAA